MKSRKNVSPQLSPQWLCDCANSSTCVRDVRCCNRPTYAQVHALPQNHFDANQKTIMFP